MKWKEQLRKDKQTLAGLAPRQKMLFIWDYYKLPILSLLLVAVLAGPAQQRQRAARIRRFMP